MTLADVTPDTEAAFLRCLSDGDGRTKLTAIEDEARAAGAETVVAWGVESSDWNPVSYYERMGYARAEVRDRLVLVWKKLAGDAPVPRFWEPRMPKVVGSKRVHLAAGSSRRTQSRCEDGINEYRGGSRTWRT